MTVSKHGVTTIRFATRSPSKRFVVVKKILAFAIMAFASPALAAPVPFVGCASNGQLGPQPAPQKQVREVPGPEASGLANYAMADGTRTLAPRGWRCAGLYGSDGAVLFVAPDATTLQALTAGRKVSGPAVVRRTLVGGTSGRFAVARAVAMLFPAASGFVTEVEAEGIDGPFPRGIPRGDRVTRIGRMAALYTTPANGKGIGNRSAFAIDRLPIDGIAVLDADNDLESMDARLAPALRPLVAGIIADFRRDQGLSEPIRRR